MKNDKSRVLIKITTWENNGYFGSKIIPTVQQNGKNCMSENKQSIKKKNLT